MKIKGGSITHSLLRLCRDGDGKNKIKYYVDVTVTTTYSYPSAQEKPQDPRNDPKYDSIDWQDDDPSKNLSIEEMDEILEERENEESDTGGDDSGEEGSDGGDNNYAVNRFFQLFIFNNTTPINSLYILFH
jgi:hypothetical protein